MEKNVLQVENLGKRYNLNRQREVSLWEDIKGKAQTLFGQKTATSEEETIWAVRNLSFALDQGDVLGIIGKNGAGKSTLLKMLAEVTSPTEGVIEYSGNLTSILEVGTGFHPDLTGRQNVFLSASLVGLDPKQVESRFDEIVDFSGIAPFIDVPVKQYSSGMYLRLAFSLAFHTDMDILVLDEVLSVGDVDFRRKSAQRIKEIARSGTTVILVSHELASIRSLCSKCMLLEKGEMVAFGPTREIVDGYLDEFYASLTGSGEGLTSYLSEIVLDHPQIRFISSSVSAKGKPLGAPILMKDEVVFQFQFEKKTQEEGIVNILEIVNYDHLILSDSPAFRETFDNQVSKEGIYHASVSFPASTFNEGTFMVNLIFCFTQTGKVIMELPHQCRFHIQSNPNEVRGSWGKDTREYAIRPRLHWEYAMN